MIWIHTLRSRTLNGMLAAALTLPMGAPSVYAYGAWDDLRPKPSAQVETTLERLESEVSGDSSPTGSTAEVPSGETSRATAQTPKGADVGRTGDTTWVFAPQLATPAGAPLGRDKVVGPSVVDELQARAKEGVARAFEEARAFVFWQNGRISTDEQLKEQADQYATARAKRTGKWLSKGEGDGLVKRLTAARDAMLKTVRTRLTDQNEVAGPMLLGAVRMVVILDEHNLPALASSGIIGTPEHRALMVYGGYHRYQGAPANAWSLYPTLAEIEGLAASEDGQKALALKLKHEYADVQRGHHEDEPAEVTQFVNEQIGKVFADYAKKQLDAAEQARQKELNLTIMEFASLCLRDHASTVGVPEEAIAAAKQVLAAAKERGVTDAYWVVGRGDDLKLQINHHHGQGSPVIGRLTVEAGTAALNAVANAQVLKPASRSVLTADYLTRAKALGIRRDVVPMNERTAEPVLVVDAVNGGAGTFNLPLWRAFFRLDSHPSARIAGDKFRGVVERIDDVRRGKKDRARYVFDPGKEAEMYALIGDHSEYMLSEVYAVEGRFSQSNPGEPVAKIIVEPMDAADFTKRAANPRLIVRVQSGSEALGVLTDALGNPWIAPGGPNDAHHLTTIPVAHAQGNRPPQQGYINLVAYEYMSYGNGRIPLERDVIDPFNPVATPDAGLLKTLWGDKWPELQVTFQLAQERAHKIANFMMSHGEMDPFLTARGAEALSARTAESVQAQWLELPKTEEGEVDEVVRIANEASRGRTLSIIKADAGGEGGHLIPPAYFSLAAEASLELMKEDGLIVSAEHFAVGDDNQNVAVHVRGMDNHAIHINNYRVFWRMVYLAANYEVSDNTVKVRSKDGVQVEVNKIFGAKIYQAGQDLVSEAARGKPVPALAGVDDRFVDRLVALLKKVGRDNQAEAVRYGYYEIYKRELGDPVVAAVSPFKGNITGQGPGFAEFPLIPEGPTRLFAVFTDKDGPAAFNVPIVWMLEQALSRGLIRKKGGAIAEIHNTKTHQRIFLDVETQMDIIRGLAANPDTYNFKRVISKAKQGWNAANWQEYVGSEWFISTSTEKLSIITGGEYRGKDDSVMLVSEEFADYAQEFDARFSFFTQGDGFGSHDTTVRTELLPTAIATMHSRAVKSAFWIDITADNTMRFTEVYTDPAFRQRRREGEEITRMIWDVQGVGFTPVGVGWRRVERSYPLAKTIVEITGIEWDLLAETTTDVTEKSVDDIVKSSRYAVKARVDAAESIVQGQWADQFSAVDHQTTAKVSRAAHDLAAPKTILIHPSFFAQGPDGAMAIQRTLNELGFANADEAAQRGALTLAVPVNPLKLEGGDQSVRVVLGTVASTAAAEQAALVEQAGKMVPSSTTQTPSPVPGVEGVAVRGNLAQEFADVLTPDVLSIAADVDRAIRDDRQAALALHEQKLNRARAGERVVQFRDPTQQLTDAEGETWTVQEIHETSWIGAIPQELIDASTRAQSVQELFDWIDAQTNHPEYQKWKKPLVQWAQLTGPADAHSKLAYGLNSGANGYLIDLEDALNKRKTLISLRNIRQAVNEDPAYLAVEAQMKADGKLTGDLGSDRWPLMIPRPSALHLGDEYVVVDGVKISASVLDTVALIAQNHQAWRDKHGQDPVLYVPKINSFEEAVVWDKLLTRLEVLLGLNPNTVKIQLMVERIWEMAELEEVMWALRNRLTVINAGRYDYSNSWLEAMAGDPFTVSPAWAQMTMDKAFLRHYIVRIGQLAAKHGVMFIGGMAQQIPERDAAANQRAMERVDADKTNNEIPFGASGAWMAHPGMNETLQGVFKRELKGRPNQLGRADLGRPAYTPNALEMLLVPHAGEITEEDVRFAINTQLQYDVSYWSGNAAAGIYNTTQGLRLMEDRATTETHFRKLWEWVHKSQAKLKDGRRITPELFTQLLNEELEKLEKGENNAVKAQANVPQYQIARAVLERAVKSDVLIPWFTDLLHLVDRYLVDGVTDPAAVAATAVDRYIEVYAKTGVRLTQLNASIVTWQSGEGDDVQIVLELRGPQAKKVAARLVQDEARERFARMIDAVNAASQGAAHLKPEWFTLTPNGSLRSIDVAIGPASWLSALTSVPVRVALDDQGVAGRIESSASAFYAGLEAVASGNRKLPPEVQQKLRVAGEDGLFTVSETEVDADVERDLRAYQDTVTEASGNL